MDESVVEAGEDVGYAENELAVSDLWAERDGGGFLGGLVLGGASNSPNESVIELRKVTSKIGMCDPSNEMPRKR